MTLPYDEGAMTPRGGFGPTDIARQNADVWITVGWWLARLLLPIAAVCLAVARAVGLHDHVAVTPEPLVPSPRIRIRERVALQSYRDGRAF
jgi:hypothetical protein